MFNFNNIKMTNHKILRLPEVIKITGKARSTIYLDIKNGLFPSSIKLGVKSVGWIESDIQNWIDSKIQDKEVRDA